MIIYVASKKEMKNCPVEIVVSKWFYLMQMGKCPAGSRDCCLPSTGLLCELQREEFNRLERWDIRNLRHSVKQSVPCFRKALQD